MQRCKELSRLPRAPHFSSLLFRKQSPASSSAIQPLQKAATVLDPGHPAAYLPRKILPRFRNSVFSVTATPFGLLEPESIPCQPPFDVSFETWAERISRSLTEPITNGLVGPILAPVCLPKYQKRGRLPMSLVTVVGKKATSKKKVVRLRIINKVKNALNLAVTRVAEVKDGKLVLDEALSRENLICRGWTYSVYPSLEVYRMSFTELIPTVLQALRSIHKQVTELENSWAQKSFENQLHKSSTWNITQHSPVSSKLPLKTVTSHERRNRRLLDAEMNDLTARSPMSSGEWPSERSTMSDGTVSTQFPSRTEFKPSKYPEEKNRSAGKVEGLSQLLARISSAAPQMYQNEGENLLEEHQSSHVDSLASHPTNTNPVTSKDLLRIRRSRETQVATSLKEKVFATRPIVGNIPQVKEKFRFKDSVSHRDRQKREREKSENSSRWVKTRKSQPFDL
ncbi:uncharacterized protein C8R40DRAFT_1176643 [Lentinula edodes]|uniref:uncharacterized protein n=1 Tax=Lentinula edodes TaxID=5353 RepID=UPI001E8EBE6C|nr:uncharacterized protein C8R40DRAFT_1176643 [Lentinula edodes]KAH7869493.1 hypothetical protein C8R40DRAFT_1176643 [Lentinula edodes]